MAALFEPVPISVEPIVCGVESGREEDTVIISNAKSFVNTVKLSDQKLVSSLPVHLGISVTSPAVWNEKNQEYLLVQNKQNVCIWKQEQTSLDKAKKRHIATDLHKLFSLPSFVPIILCKNGSIGFLGSDNFKEGCEKAVLPKGADIIWCSALERRGGACVLFVSQQTRQAQKDLAIHCWWYSSQDDLSHHTSAPLESHGALLSCACYLGISREVAKLFTLWDDGTLHETLLKERSTAEQGQSTVVKGVSAPCSIFCLSYNNFVIVGLQRNNHGGIAILDRKFSQIRAWQSFPFKGTFDKAFFQRDHILVQHGSTMYMYRYECQMGTLASMMGHLQGTALTEGDCPSIGLQASSDKRRQSADVVEEDAKHQEVQRILGHLADPKQTSTYTSFKRDFAHLKSRLSESSVWAYLGELSAVLKRCCSENKFWPASELEFLISQHCISTNDLVMLFETLKLKNAVSLMYKALTLQLDELPEACLGMALQCFLSASEEAVNTAVESTGQNSLDTDMVNGEAAVSDAGDETDSCPLSKSRAFLINKVIWSPFDETYLLSAMRKLPFHLVVDLLKYILYALKHPARTADKNVEKENQWLLQLSRWEAIALDAHATQVIMAKDAHELIIKFSELEDRYVSFVTDANKELTEKLKHMMTKTADKQKKRVGQYCIEVLHLY